MKRGGRYSAADRATPLLREPPRPKPPRGLSAEGREVWRETVNAFRSDWFTGAETVLAAYCDIVVLNRRLAGMVGECGGDNPRFPELVRMYHADVATLVRLATCLRATPQSTRSADQGKLDPGGGARPWDDLVEGEPN